jgi:formylglycine-generating enzyme required for sulfatase activity
MPVGTYEQGKSVDNIYDLIGNVEEWSQTKNVVVGGSWASGTNWIRNRTLVDVTPSVYSSTIGFRCAKDVP